MRLKPYCPDLLEFTCLTINDKNLNYEIETTASKADQDKIMSINDKNLNYEIETVQPFTPNYPLFHYQ